MAKPKKAASKPAEARPWGVRIDPRVAEEIRVFAREQGMFVRAVVERACRAYIGSFPKR